MRALELIDSDLNARRAFPPAGAVWQSPQRPHTVGKPAQTRRVSLPPSHGPSRRSAPAPRTRGGGGRGLSGGALSGSTSGGGTSGGALRGGGSTSGAACWCCAGLRRVLAPSRVRAAGRAPHARVSSASRTTRAAGWAAESAGARGGGSGGLRRGGALWARRGMRACMQVCTRACARAQSFCVLARQALQRRAADEWDGESAGGMRAA